MGGIQKQQSETENRQQNKLINNKMYMCDCGDTAVTDESVRWRRGYKVQADKTGAIFLANKIL